MVSLVFAGSILRISSRIGVAIRGRNYQIWAYVNRVSSMRDGKQLCAESHNPGNNHIEFLHDTGFLSDLITYFMIPFYNPCRELSSHVLC
jgi:hypothetical protein